MAKPEHRTGRRALTLLSLLMLILVGAGLALTAIRAPSPPPVDYEIVASCSARGGCPLSASPQSAPPNVRGAVPASRRTSHR